jgi:hypothetical protein
LAGSLSADPPEGPGELFDLVGVEDWAAVLGDEQRACVVDQRGDANPAAWLVVADDVVDYVLDHPGEQRLATGDPRVRAVLLLDGQSDG